MKEQCYQNYLEISREDLRFNARSVREAVGVPVIGVVKCDGYGVSIPEAAAAWRDAGVTMLAVSELEEALELRESGAKEEILLLAPTADPVILDALLEQNIILTVSSPETARFYAQHRGDRLLRVHVAVDTGMGRFGFRWDDREALEAVYRTEGLIFEGIFSHFAAAFEKDYRLTKIQLERFLSAVAAVEEMGFRPGLRHIANSCAALRFPETRLDAVRVGSALVGRLPAPVPVDLRRVGIMRAMVVDRRTLRKGDTTGYAAICRLKRDTDVAVVAIGHQSTFGLMAQEDQVRFVDLLRALWHVVKRWRRKNSLRWQGKTLPVVGRIGTQYTLVDAGGTALAPGDLLTTEANMMMPHPRRKFV